MNSNNNNILVINKNRKIGINKNPTRELDVNGSVIISQDLNVNNSLSIKGNTQISGFSQI